MSDTNSEKIELGQKAYVEEKVEINDSTKMQAEEVNPSLRIIQKKIDPSIETETVYVRVNFDSKKKKDAYRKINRKLERG